MPGGCPYCKILFHENEWARPTRPGIVCLNCKNYADVMKEEVQAERALYENKK